MPVIQEYKKIYQKLMQESVAEIVVGGFNITIRIYDNARKFSLITDVYSGGNYIPKSVRECMTKHPNLTRDNPRIPLKTFVTLDEPNFRIYLNYLGLFEGMNNESFRSVMDDFSWQAEQWRIFLDENDKKDLIYVRVKSK
jgi:hypothetical protein